jgi:poly(3-hydroxyalkanoate) synthetase
LHHGFRVHLLEWIPPSSDGSAGLDAYGGRAIAACVATISKQANGAQPFLMGHSLGGTLAAIYCALEPRSVKLSAIPRSGISISARTASVGGCPGKATLSVCQTTEPTD